ncbi:ATP-dependent helicase [Paraliomyxa miuraensis]|uniref:ATP-dependent helicase n=1 Tax=Paraliomyxa miuraensis TaxID=376150 RepID=UPI00224FF158|nr:UvrD-helicase domain-containing protein [Paraliomyxa miuraensis]MCX4243867.1 UvrD-helicase domain-containing protein [Paraliomyxa miuraensis]
MSLNPAQRAAVEHRGGPLLVLAGAGTGKTRVITHRVAQLMDEGVEPWRILAVTFTNKAAGEMRERIVDLCDGRHPVRELWVGTFHSICARILRRHGEGVGLSPRFSIYDPGDQVTVMTQVLKDLKVPDKLYSPRGVLGWLDRAKNQGFGPRGIDRLQLPEPVASVARQAYELYDKRLRAADAADFGDLLRLTVELLRDAGRAKAKGGGGQLADLEPAARLLTRFQHVVVDEFQDTNPVQAELVDLLSARAELCVVGDDDQAIYGWRGADVEQILRFGDRHSGTEIIRLEQNYRSTTRILRCADAVIRRNQRRLGGRLGKTLWSDRGEGEAVRVIAVDDERDEARLLAYEILQAIDEGASPDDFAVFYRTHAQSRAIEEQLRRAGLSCRIIGGVAFYERMEVKDVLSYLSVLINPHSDVHLQRIVNRPARKIGKSTVTKLQEHAAAEGVSLWQAMHEPQAAGLARAAAKRVLELVGLIEQLRARMGELRLDALMAEIVDSTGYRAWLDDDGSEEARARLENLQELMGNAQEFAQERPDAEIFDYLELVSLVGGERGEGDRGRAITMMTIHSAKGLEFPVVYLTGMEERIFPHARVLEDQVQMEEERRLAYVAITRARDRLTLTLARRRRIYGQLQVGTPSRFVGDLPPDAVASVGLRQATRYVAVSRPSPLPAPSGYSPAPAPAREPGWQDDIEYDAEPELPFTDAELGGGFGDEVGEGVALYVGMTWRHAKFGRGELLGWSGTGASLKLQLRFPGHGVKTILARFCDPL